jgi:hypothetical protein
MRLWGRCCLAAEVKALARDACGNLQLCAGLQAGIEGSLHAVRAIWPEAAGWTHDRGTDEQPTNIFQQLLDGTERELNVATAMQSEDTAIGSDNDEDQSAGGVSEADPLAVESSEYNRYEPNTGFGALLVDASNAFNEICRYLMLYACYYRWNKGSRFAFNRYRHHNIVYVRANPGEPAHVILSQEGVAQGCTFGSFCYGIGIMPLAERMITHIPEALQPWFADDASATGRAIHYARCMIFLAEHRPAYGYWANPRKINLYLQGRG